MKMIEGDLMIIYTCPNCGHYLYDKKGKDIECPYCRPEFKGWTKEDVDRVVEKLCTQVSK